ncbi:MAG TPA: hypothetical protein PL182_12760 [Pseudobdellovibrionaceae bacterium]|nr:hypothetical protein [Pseudobdellovibrionaceae bacterium]
MTVARFLTFLKGMGILLGLLFVGSPAWSACTSPAGDEGQLRWTGSVFQYCSNVTWRNADGTSTGSACSSAGEIAFASGELRGCTGSVWVRLASTTLHGACAAGSAGHFYYSTPDDYYWFCSGSNWRRIP